MLLSQRDHVFPPEAVVAVDSITRAIALVGLLDDRALAWVYERVCSMQDEVSASSPEHEVFDAFRHLVWKERQGLKREGK